MIAPKCPEHSSPLVDVNKSTEPNRKPIFACPAPECRRLERLYCDRCTVVAEVPMERIQNPKWKPGDPDQGKDLLKCPECERTLPRAEGVARWNWEMYHSCVRVMAEFYDKELHDVLLNTPKGAPGPNMAWGLYLRTECWLSSVVRMDNPRDIQAIAGACRSLLEIMVDLVHIRHDFTGEHVRKMLAWEQSNKLKQATNLLRYYTETNQPLPKGYQPQADFVKNQGPTIIADRAKYWNGRAAERWTDRSLEIDCKAADKLENFNLLHFYATNYRHICWHVHGSGMTGIRELDEVGVYTFAALGMLHCADMGSKIARLVMQEIGDLWRYDKRLHAQYILAEKNQLKLMDAAQQA